MEKKDIVKILNEISIFYELKGENFFKIRAYQIAAKALEISEIKLTKNTTLEEIQEIKGIGKSIATQIKALIDTGKLQIYEDLKKSIPAGLIEMLKIPKLGPKKIKYLYENLNISTVSELEYACLENKLINLPGFGKKTQENILHGIELIKKYKERFLYSEVINQALNIENKLRSFNLIENVSIAGSLRRKKETIKDIDIVASTSNINNAKKIMDFFTSLEEVEEIIAKGETKSSVRLKSGINSDLRLVSTKEYPFALHHFTGSKEHNTAMRAYVKKLSIKMNEYGLFKVNEDGTEEIIETKDKFKTEKDIFSFFKMDYIEPELRENTGEIEASLNKKLPKLIEEKDLKGIFHFHTTFSDGAMTIEQAVKEIKSMGFSYCGITDHSKTAKYAGGIEEEKLDNYFEAIKNVNEKYNDFKVFAGIESDILPDGSLDYDDEILEKFDFVIIAIHSNFNMDKRQMTERIIKAMQNKYSTILSHPTGRLLLARDPYEVDITEIINAAAKYNVDLEINASPFRLDLDWLNCKYAKDKNVKLFINPDAHNLDGLHDYKYGINIARKGWLEKENVANTMSLNEMIEYLKLKKQNKSLPKFNISLTCL